MEYENRLYLILHPGAALVASQLNPIQFARHYVSGSSRHYEGKVIFASLDLCFRNPYFHIEGGLKALSPHEDGRPKATKFISTYRVLEHIDFQAVQKLYLATPDAAVQELSPLEHKAPHTPGMLRIFAEIDPIKMLVLTSYDFIDFGRFITDPNNSKGAPRIFYTQIDLDIDTFLNDYKKNPFVSLPIAILHPAKLRAAIYDLKDTPQKKTKGLSLYSSLNQLSYRCLRHGFIFASQEDSKFFPLPAMEEIERLNYKFWRSM